MVVTLSVFVPDYLTIVNVSVESLPFPTTPMDIVHLRPMAENNLLFCRLLSSNAIRGNIIYYYEAETRNNFHPWKNSFIMGFIFVKVPVTQRFVFEKKKEKNNCSLDPRKGWEIARASEKIKKLFKKIYQGMVF